MASNHLYGNDGTLMCPLVLPPLMAVCHLYDNPGWCSTITMATKDASFCGEALNDGLHALWFFGTQAGPQDAPQGMC